jgi:hypothetical protein
MKMVVILTLAFTREKWLVLNYITKAYIIIDIFNFLRSFDSKKFKEITIIYIKEIF